MLCHKRSLSTEKANKTVINSFIRMTIQKEIMKNLITLFVLGTLFQACQSAKKEQAADDKVPVKKELSLTKKWETDTLLNTVESALYDAKRNVIYASCINGVPPTKKDGDGFIAKVSPEDGSIIDRNWISGIDAPKGMGLYGEWLYVTNINELIRYNVESGEMDMRFTVDGAVFLNDVAVDENGVVYFSDTRTNKIHKLEGNEISTWVEDENMGNPNGLFHDGERIMMATFGSGTFNTIDFAEQKVQSVVDSIPGGDGVVKVGMDYIVSNWNGEIYYVGSNWEKTKILDTIEAGDNAADIDFIPESNTLLVPTFFGNRIVAYKLNN